MEKENLGEGKVSIKKTTLKVIKFSILGRGVRGGRGGLPDFHIFVGGKNVFFLNKYEDDQNGLIHPEN